MMRVPANLMMAIGKVALKFLGADLVIDVVEIARAAWDDWKGSPEERLAEIEAIIGSDDEALRQAADQFAADLAPNEPAPVRAKLATFLKQVPNRLRQSQRRPDVAAVLAESLSALLRSPVKPEPPPKEIINSMGMRMKRIPAGEFLMGSTDSEDQFQSGLFPVDEFPQHRVRITRPFYLGIHQVTRGQFGRFVEATQYQTEVEKSGQGGIGADAPWYLWEQDPKFTWRSPGFQQTDDHPVVNVSWNDASAFCEWLSRQEGEEYRLPTEAEWEYACRAGTRTQFCFGDDEKHLGQYAWYAENSNNQTHPVGEKKANAFGLHDMHGNVAQWCWDLYIKRFYESANESMAIDPKGPASGWCHVFRGSNWLSAAGDCRATCRGGRTPPLANSGLGLRLARVPSGL